MYVYTSPRTQGSSRQASRTLQPVANTSRQTTARACAASISIRPSIQSGPQDRRSAASVRLSGGLASTAASTRRFAVMPTSRPLCFRPPSCCSHHLPQSTSQTVVWAPASGCQLQQWSQGGLGIKEMLTRCDSKVCDGRRTWSARHLVDLTGSACGSAEICYERWTHVPATLERFTSSTRLTPDKDGSLATLCGQGPI